MQQIDGRNRITDEHGTGRSGASECGGGSGGALPLSEASASVGAS